eukprot:XP_014780008.1 PREDICTED: zinc finger protein 695-like [Octopus bimaculoides]
MAAGTQDLYRDTTLSMYLMRTKLQNYATQHVERSCTHKGQYKDSSNLISHRHIHAGEKLYHCGVCGKSFPSAILVTRHKRFHTGESPYHCDICGKSFSQSGNLATHKRFHTGEKPYHCDICGRSFTQHGKLTSHKRVHKGTKQSH